MRNNISGAQAYRNALRQQYQQQVNAAVQQIAAQRAAGQQAMGNTYQQLKPTVQDNLGGFAGAIDTYNKNLKAELEAQQKAEQAAQKAWAAQAVKDIKAARKSTTSTKSTESTKAAADAASEESYAAENSDSLFGTPGKNSKGKPEKEDEEEKKPGLLSRAGNAIKNGAVNIRNSMKETANDRQQKRIQEAENHKVNKADELDAARQAAAQNNRDLIQKKNLTQNDKNVIFQRYNNWIQQGNNRDIVDVLNAIDEIKNEQQSEVQGAGWNKNALEQKLSQYSKNDIDLANEYRAMYNRIPGYRVSDRTWNTALGVGKTILSAPMQAVDYAGQTFNNAVASLNNEEYRNAVKQQNSALLKMQTMEDQGLAYAYNEKGQVLGETQQYKALREQFENAKSVTDNLSSVINQPVSKESAGYQMYQSGQENLIRSDMGLSDAQKFVKGAATSAVENIAIAAVNPALVVPVLSAQGAADSFAQSTANEESAFIGLVKGTAKGMAAYAINSVGVEQMLDTMGMGGARNTIASKVVQYLKNDSVLSGFAKSNPALYAVLMGTTDNGLQSFAETWADYAIDLATNTAEPKSMEQLLQESLQNMASGALGGAMTAVAGLGVNAGRQALYNKVAGNAETAQQNVQTETAEKVSDNRASAEQNTTGQNTAVQDVINNLTTGENGGNGNTNRTAKAFYLNVSPETAQKNAENRAALAAALGVDESSLPTNNKEMRQFIQGLKPDNFGKTNNYVGEIDAMMEQKQQENAEIRDNSWNGENLSGEISKTAGIHTNNKEADRAVETMRKSWISDEAESLYRSSNQAGEPAFTRAFEQAYRSGLDGNAQNKNTAAYAMAGEQAMEIVDKAYQQGRADHIARNHADASEFVPIEVLNAKHNKDLLFVEKPKDNGAQRAGKIVEKIAKAQGNRNVFWVEDAPFNGKKDGNGNIYLNASLSSGEAVRTYFGHEITHIAENSKFYKDLSKFIQDSETGKEWVRQRGFDSFDEYAEAKYRIYADKADQTGNESYRLASMDEAMQEVVADWCGENLLGDSSISERAIRELCGENRSFATKVKDFLADMVERFFGTSEEDELRHALDLFEKALGESNKKAAAQDGDEKFKVVDGYRSDILEYDVRGQETANSNSLSTDSKADAVVSDKNGNAVAEQDGGNVVFSLSTYEEEGREVLHSYLDKMAKRHVISKAEAKEIFSSLENVHDQCRDLINNDGEGKYKSFTKWSDAKVVLRDDGTPVLSCIVSNKEYPMDIDFSQICTKRGTMNKVLNYMVDNSMLDYAKMDGKSLAQVNRVIKDYGFDIACTMCYVEAKRYKSPEWASKIANEYNRILDAAKIVDGEVTDKAAMEKVVASIAKEADNKGKGPTGLMKSILNNPSIAKQLSPGQLLSSNGFEEIKKSNPTLYSAIISHDGSSSPKALLSETQYQSELLKAAGDENRWRSPANSWDTNTAFSVGGVRIQSFSDFVPKMFFDYCQVMADTSAKKLPMHGYSKVESFIRLFGLTGAKLNMSLVPTISLDGKPVVGSKAKAWAGFLCDENGNPIKGDDGLYKYAWADESFDFDTAIEIQSDKRYSKNCGTCAIGVSDNHIRQMMNDPNIKMIIPYHKSGINSDVSKFYGISAFTDYTYSQNNANAKLKRNPGESFADYYARLYNGNGGLNASKNEEYKFDFYNDLVDTENPAQTALNYLKACQRDGIIPKFAQFAYNKDGSYNENYYKLLTDFTLTDSDGEYAQQEIVQWGEDSLPENWKDILKSALQKETETDHKVDALLPQIASDIQKALGMQPVSENPKSKLKIADEYSDIRYSVSEPDTISKKNRELARQNQKLTEQNERLKTTIGILKGEFKRSAGHKIADQSMNRLVSRLKGQNKSTIEREVLKQKLTKLFDYVQNAETNELNFDDVMDVTADIAKDILSNSRDTGESLRESDTRYQELYKNLGTIEVTAKEKARIEAAYGKAQFGKINGIKIKVVDNARSLDDVLHNDLAASYPEFFSGDISTAEDVFDRMAQVRSALNDPVLDNDSGMSFDEMAYSLAQQIWDEYLDMPDTRAKTYADKQADKFKAAKEEFRAQLEAQRAEAKAEYEQSLKTVQRENAAAIEQVRGETIGLRKRLAKANQELADLNKRSAAQEKTIGKQAEKIDIQSKTIAENKQKMRDLRSESKEAEKAARRNVNTAYDFGVADQRAVGDAKIAAKQKQIDKLKADIKDRQQKMRDLRSEKNQKILDTRAKYRGMMDKQRENRAKTELRNKIKKNGMALASALAKPTKSKYVPKELVRTAADLCDIIESTARAGKSRKTQYQQKLADLRTLYTQMKNSKDFDMSSEYQADVDDMIQELNQKALSRNPNARTADTVTEVQSKVLSAGQFADRSLNDLTTSELSMLNNVISAINNTISKAGQAHTKAYTLSLSETRTKAANEVKAGHRLNPKNKAEQAITNQFLNYMTPLRLFRYIGGYSENGAVQQMYNSLNDAAVETSAIELKGNSFFSDIASDSKNLSKFSGSGADRIKLQTRNETLNDVEVEVTPAIMANMLDVWAHNPEEVERSGFVIPDLALYHKGMTKQAYANGTVIKPSAEQWLQWSADSTMYGDYAKQWSKALSEQNAFIAPKMRETQLDIQGFTNIGEGDHRTLYRDKSYVKGTTEIVGGGKTLVHDGFTKNRVEGARQPLYAMDITEFAKKTVHDTSVFAGMSAALLDFSRIYDGPVFTGQVDMDGAPISNKTLAGMIEQQYTPTATNYIKNLLDDIREQPRADQSAALGKLLGNVASASLSMNVIGTPIKQSPSFYAASSVIGLKPLLKTNAQLTKQYAITPEEIMQYTPLLALRNEQGGSQELAALKRGTGKIAGFTAKLPGTKLISWVDMHTVKALWAASADYVHSQNASLDTDSTEFKQEVAKVFNRCVQETQPNYSTLQRSEMQRSGNAFYRILGQFKTQPIQNGNILLDAYLNMKANKGSKAASKEFGQALAGQTLSLVAFVALGNLGRLIMHQFKYWTDPDKEEVTAEQVAKAFGSDALSSVLGMIPGGTEALEIVQGYDYSNVTTSFINDFVDSSKRVYDNFPKIFDEELSDSEREAAKNKVLKGAAKIIDLTGLPASTTVRLADAVNGWYKDITAGELNSQQKPTESVQKARLYNAYLSGDEKQRTLAYDSLIGMGVLENDINSAMMTKLGSEDDMKQAAQQLADNFLESDDEIEAVISKYTDLGFSEYLVRNKVRSMADSIVSKETEKSKYEIIDNTMDYLESNDIYNWLGEEDRAAVQQSVSGDAAKMAKQQAGYEQKYSEGEKYLAKVSVGDSEAYMKLRAAYIAANRKATKYGKSDNDFKNFYNAVTGSAYSKSLKSALLQAKNGNSKLENANADQILAYYGASTQADTDGNSRVSQDEFKAYVQKSGMSRSAAAYVWSIRWPKSSNPYM